MKKKTERVSLKLRVVQALKNQLSIFSSLFSIRVTSFLTKVTKSNKILNYFYLSCLVISWKILSVKKKIKSKIWPIIILVEKQLTDLYSMVSRCYRQPVQVMYINHYLMFGYLLKRIKLFFMIKENKLQFDRGWLVFFKIR